MEPRFATLLDDIAAPLPSAPKSWDKNALGDAAVAAVVVDLDDNDVNLRTATPTRCVSSKKRRRLSFGKPTLRKAYPRFQGAFLSLLPSVFLFWLFIGFEADCESDDATKAASVVPPKGFAILSLCSLTFNVSTPVEPLVAASDEDELCILLFLF